MRLLGMVLGLLLASLCLAEVVTVRGTVLGPDDKPVAGAAVLVSFRYRENGDQQTTTTDARGAFTVTLQRKPEDMRYPAQTLVYAPGFALGGGAGTTPDMIVRLQPAATAGGLVIDAKGKPVAGVTVLLVNLATQPGEPASLYFPSRSPLRAHYTAVTGPDGRWTLQNLPPAAQFNCTIADPQYIRNTFSIALPQKVDRPLTVTVTPAATITGKVRFADGTPAAGITVSLPYRLSARTTTGTDGTYLLERLAAGPVNVVVTEPSGQWVAAALTAVPLSAGETTYSPDIVLTPGAFIDVIVTDEGTGQPIEGVAVECYGPHNLKINGLIRRIGTRTDVEGHCRLRVAQGKNSVDLIGGFGSYLWSGQDTEIAVNEGETITLPIRLKKGLTLTGTLVDSAAKPVTGTNIRLLVTPAKREGDARGRTVQIDEVGAFTTTGLTPGVWRLGSIAVNGNPRPWEIVSPTEITLPTDQPVTVVLRSLTALSGRVVTQDGKPVPYVRVNFRMSADASTPELRPCTSDADGRFVMEVATSDATKVTFDSVNRTGYQYLSGGAITLVEGQLRMEDIVMEPVTAVQTK